MLTIGTAGHIDHGKTTLTQALTGKNTDSLPEERSRGISITLGFAQLETSPGNWLGLVDVPGHERFVHTMVAGAWGIQGFMLVLAADEGVMPQTREHLNILRLLGVQRGLVVLSKQDLVDPDMLELVEAEAHEVLSEGDFPDTEVLAYSPGDLASVEAVRAALERLRTQLDHPQERGLFRLPVDRVFSLKGRGTVVTGTLASGRVEVGQEVTLLPGDSRSRVRSIHTFDEDRNFARAGERTALNLPDLSTSNISRGMVVTRPQTLIPVQVLDARVELLRGLPEAFTRVRTGTRLRVHLGTSTATGRLHLLGSRALPAGDSQLAQIRLDEPLVAVSEDRFLLRAISPVLTIGGGRILEVASPRYKRGTAVLPRLRRIETEGGSGLIRARLESCPRLLETVPSLAATLHLPVKEIRSLLKGPTLKDLGRRNGPGGPYYGIRSRLERGERLLLQALGKYHLEHPEELGLSREALSSLAGLSLPGEILQVLLLSLEANHKVVPEQGRFRLPTHEANLATSSLAARDSILAVFETEEIPFQGVHNLSLAAGIEDNAGKKILDALVKTGDLARLPGGVYTPKKRLEGLRTRVLEILDASRPQAVTAQEFKQELGLTRRSLIPLLESMDEAGMTLRAGPGRIRRPGYKGDGC
jgi:selenocysteine-specific elongation factor